MRPIFIVLRASPDWLNYDLAQSVAFCRRLGRPDDMIIRFARLVDRFSAIPFLRLRHEFKTLALESFAACRNTRLIGRGDLERGIVEDALYAFTDDDDWFRPDLAEVLQRDVPNSAEAVMWGSIRFGYRSWGDAGVPEAVQKRPLHSHVFTNNYAVAGHALKRLGALDPVFEHDRAHRAWTAGTLAFHRIDAYLSCANKHPACTVVAQHAAGDGSAPEDFAAFLASYRAAVEAARYCPHTEWLRPYVDRLKDLCRAARLGSATGAPEAAV